MQMPLRFAYRKPQGDVVQEGRVGYRHLPLPEIMSDAEDQFIAADRDWPPADQRLIGTAVRIRRGARDDTAFAERRAFDKLDLDPRRGLAAMGIEHMGREPAVNGQPVAGDD